MPTSPTQTRCCCRWTPHAATSITATAYCCLCLQLLASRAATERSAAAACSLGAACVEYCQIRGAGVAGGVDVAGGIWVPATIWQHCILGHCLIAGGGGGLVEAVHSTCRCWRAAAAAVLASLISPAVAALLACLPGSSSGGAGPPQMVLELSALAAAYPEGTTWPLVAARRMTAGLHTLLDLARWAPW